MPIGRFSELTRLSVKALRHYDEIGLLTPAMVDPETGYRSYRPSQADRALAIGMLRRIDMSLDDIRATLDEDPLANLAEHRDRLVRRLAEDRAMLERLDAIVDRGGAAAYTVTSERRPPQPIASLRRTTSIADMQRTLGDAFGKLFGAVTSAGSHPTGAPFVVFWDLIDEHSTGDIEVGMPVPPDLHLDGDVATSRSPDLTVAVTVHRGPFEHVGPAYHALSRWMQEHGHEPAGPPIESYLDDPGQVPIDRVRTEIAWPIAVRP